MTIKRTDAERKALRRHRGKECFLCEQRLTTIARGGGCCSVFSASDCWWVPTIATYGLDEAVRMSNEKRAAEPSPTSAGAYAGLDAGRS